MAYFGQGLYPPYPPAERVADPAVKAELRANTDEAIEVGVFGVPTIVAERELFWGYDVTGMAVDYLREPGAFEDKAMRTADRLPVGVQRSAERS